jgi:tetratricopeptide (TPR) repeat protein
VAAGALGTEGEDLHPQFRLTSGCGDHRMAPRELRRGRQAWVEGVLSVRERMVWFMDSPEGASSRPPRSYPVVLDFVPEDVRNTAPETRARYRYQDECAALAILRHLRSEELEGVVIEQATDLMLVPASGIPELVSIKHREPSQSASSGWSSSALRKQQVIEDLYRAWMSADGQCTLAFWSNAGFVGSAYDLWRACANSERPSLKLLAWVSKMLHIDQSQAERFLSSLRIPYDPLPRRKEITPIGISLTAEILRNCRKNPIVYPTECYRALVTYIARAGTDVPEGEAKSESYAPTLAALAASKGAAKLMNRYLSRTEILNDLLRINDQLSASALPDAGQHGWEPDALFTGRSSYLKRLEQLLQPGELAETAPVVIHGIPGCGKTSLAAQFAALHKGIMRTVFVNASTRTALIRDLEILAGCDGPSPWIRGISDLSGPITPVLPGNSATLLLLDGVTDAETIRGIVPRRSLCRVLITSTVRHLEQGYAHLDLPCWSRAESNKYIGVSLIAASRSSSEKLAAALGDHPLAISQAINYCRVTERTVDEFLERLRSEPLRMLEQGQASGHLVSVVKTIQMSLSAAEERWPGCAKLLTLVAHLGTDPVPVSVFDRSLATVFVRTPEVVSAMKPLGFKAATMAFLGRRKTPNRKYQVTALSREIIALLADNAWRERAIDTLLMTSLITKRDSCVTTHTLIAQVVRELDSDVRPWLEVGFGLYTELIEAGAAKDFRSLDACLDQVATLASTALEGGFDGPGVLVACHYLAHRLGVTAGDGVAGERGRNAIEFGRHAVEIVEELARLQLLTAKMVASVRCALGQALLNAGYVDEAIVEVRKNIELAQSENDEDILANAFIDLGTVGVMSSRTDVVLGILSEFDSQSLSERVDGRTLIGVNQVRAQLLRRLGRVQEAMTFNNEAIALASCMEDVRGRVLAQLHDIAAMLAKDIGDGGSAFKHSMAALEIRRAEGHEAVDSRFIEALEGAADSAIEAGELRQAKSLINEGEQLAREYFGSRSISYGHMLAVRGRLGLHLGDLGAALEDLEGAVNIFYEAPESERYNLPAPLVHLAQVALDLGDHAKAQRAITEAYEIDLSIYGPDHPETQKDVMIMNGIMALTGDLE